MRASLRFNVLLAVLVVLAIMVTTDDESSRASATGVVNATTTHRTTGDGMPAGKHSANPPVILALRERGKPEDQKDVNAFPQKDWTPPPPPPPPAPPPPPPAPPQAPPLPFVFLGKTLEGKQWTVFLAQQDRTHVVVAGDTLGHEYKIESITPPTMTIIYLPLKQPQSLPIGHAE